MLNSGVAHNHAKGDYRTRRAECEEAARQLGVPLLRDVDLQELPRVMELPEPLCRRARHVVTEDARVLAAVQVLRDGDIEALGQLFYASHDSMRDDYEVSIPEIDLIVDLARAIPDVYGARLTGGGFGGSVVMLTRPGTAASVAARVADDYAAKSGRKADGARALTGFRLPASGFRPRPAVHRRCRAGQPPATNHYISCRSAIVSPFAP